MEQAMSSETERDVLRRELTDTQTALEQRFTAIHQVSLANCITAHDLQSIKNQSIYQEIFKVA